MTIISTIFEASYCWNFRKKCKGEGACVGNKMSEDIWCEECWLNDKVGERCCSKRSTRELKRVYRISLDIERGWLWGHTYQEWRKQGKGGWSERPLKVWGMKRQEAVKCARDRMMCYIMDDVLSMGWSMSYEVVGEVRKGLSGLVVNRKLWFHCIVNDS